MRISQAFFDPDYGPPTNHPHDPRNDFEDIDLDLEAAKDEIARTPLFIVDWLAHEATADETPLDLTTVPAELQQATADQLIALVFAGHIDRIVPAVYELRVRYLRAKDGDITSRAWERYEDEIKRAQCDDSHLWF